MLTATIGDARQDVINFLNAIPIIGPKIVSGLPTVETYIKDQAKAGAESAIPDITKQVHAEAASTVKPYVYAALALGGVGAFFGTVALIKLKRR